MSEQNLPLSSLLAIFQISTASGRLFHLIDSFFLFLVPLFCLESFSPGRGPMTFFSSRSLLPVQSVGLASVFFAIGVTLSCPRNRLLVVRRRPLQRLFPASLSPPPDRFARFNPPPPPVAVRPHQFSVAVIDCLIRFPAAAPIVSPLLLAMYCILSFSLLVQQYDPRLTNSRSSAFSDFSHVVNEYRTPSLLRSR